jgi:hypothetical protein
MELEKAGEEEFAGIAGIIKKPLTNLFKNRH